MKSYLISRRSWRHFDVFKSIASVWFDVLYSPQTNTHKNNSLFFFCVCRDVSNNHSLYQRTDARRERWSTILKKKFFLRFFFSYNTSTTLDNYLCSLSLSLSSSRIESQSKSWMWKVSEYKIVHYLYCSLGFVCLSISSGSLFFVLLVYFLCVYISYFSVSSELCYWTALKSRQTKQ